MTTGASLVSVYWAGPSELLARSGHWHTAEWPKPVSLSAAHFADDLTAFVPDVPYLAQFTDTMTPFVDASGQRVNPGKTQVMLMGNLQTGEGPLTRLEAHQRGCWPWHHNASGAEMVCPGHPLIENPLVLQDLAVDWPPTLAAVAQCHSKIAGLPRYLYPRQRDCLFGIRCQHISIKC